MASRALSRRWITAAILLWAALFHYQSLRFLYLQPLLQRPLPRIAALVPDQGWSMYYNVANFWLTAEAYGMKAGTDLELIDPERLFPEKHLGVDDIRRNIMAYMLFPQNSLLFCDYLERRAPEYDGYFVMNTGYARLTPERSPKEYFPKGYQCP